MDSQDMNKNMTNFVKFITGTFLEYNMAGPSAGAMYEGQLYDPDMFKGIIQGFLDNGLCADMEHEGKNMLEIVVDSLIEGNRYALDDDGEEVRYILEQLSSTVSEEVWNALKDKILRPLVSPLNLELNEDPEEYFAENAIGLRAWLFYHLYGDLNKMTTLEEWEDLEWETIDSKNYEEDYGEVLTKQMRLAYFKDSFESAGKNFQREKIILEIVGLVRETILEQQVEIPDCEPWNEEEGGANWLDNELGMATELLERLTKREYPCWDDARTVEEIKDLLRDLTFDTLQFVRFFLEQGGSDQEGLFELREKSTGDVRNWCVNQFSQVDDNKLKTSLYNAIRETEPVVGLLAYFKSDIYIEVEEDETVEGYDEYGYSEKKEEQFWERLRNSLPTDLRFKGGQLESDRENVIVADVVIIGSRDAAVEWLNSLKETMDLKSFSLE